MHKSSAEKWRKCWGKKMFDFSAISVLVCNLGRCNKNKRHCTQFVCASLQSANKKRLWHNSASAKEKIKIIWEKKIPLKRQLHHKREKSKTARICVCSLSDCAFHIIEFEDFLKQTSIYLNSLQILQLIFFSLTHSLRTSYSTNFADIFLHHFHNVISTDM